MLWCPNSDSASSQQASAAKRIQQIRKDLHLPSGGPAVTDGTVTGVSTPRESAMPQSDLPSARAEAQKPLLISCGLAVSSEELIEQEGV